MALPNEAGGTGGWVVDPANPNRATYTDELGTVHEVFKPAEPVVDPTQPRGAMQRLKDSYNEATQYGFPGWVARKWYDWTDYGIDELRKNIPGQTDDWYESKADELIGLAQKSLREEMAARHAQDPNWSPDAGFWEAAASIDKWGPWMAGKILGSPGPESLVNPGGSAAVRIASQAGMGAAPDVVYQGLDMLDNAADEYNLDQTLISAAAGAGLQGTFEIPGFVKNLFRGRGVDTTPGQTPSGKTTPISGTRMSAEDEALYQGLLETGSVEDIMGFFEGRNGFNTNLSDVVKWVEARDAGQAQRAAVTYNDPNAPTNAIDGDQGELPFAPRPGDQPELPLEGGAPGPAPQRPEAVITPEESERVVNEAVDFINDLTKDWTNAPEFEVHADFSALPDVDPTAIGVVMPDGKVAINMANIDGPEVLSAVTFHEGLGHHGLSQKFGDDLDAILENLYDGSSKFRNDVDAWMDANPTAYEADINPIARAAEEVLSEMSEAGQISPTLMNRFRNWLKEVGRDMGLNIRYTDREIKTILGMAHDATVNGVGRDVVSNGFRYKRPEDRVAERRETRSLDRVTNFHNRNAELETTTFTNPYSEEPNTWSFSYTDKNGEPITGSYQIKPDGNIEEFSIGLSGGRPNQIGASAVRKIARDIRRQHPDAETLDGLRISGARQASGKGREDLTVSLMRYMKKKAAPVAAEVVEEAGEAPKPRVGGVNPNNIHNIKDLDYLLSEARDRQDEWFGEVVPREETIKAARDLGLTPSKLAKPGMNEEGLAARIEAGSQLLVNQMGRIQKLMDRAAIEGDRVSARTQVQITKEMATLAAIYGRVSGNNSEVGRALNILNRTRSALTSSDDLIKYMKSTGNNIYSDPAQFDRFAKMVQEASTTSEQIRLIKDSFKPKAEDFIFRLWYNMLLSSPATHVANFVGTGANFLVDLMENTGASVMGQGKRFSNAERVRGREVAYRVYGALRALSDSNTWAKSRESLNTGLTGNMPNVKGSNTNVYTGDNAALGAISGAAEAPTRLLAGADEWWRNVIQLSNFHGLAVRNAGNKGLKGREFWDEVENLIQNPTPEMIRDTNDYTKTLQFLDKPSAIGSALIDLQTPKPDSSGAGRVARGALRAMFPFVRTPDALIRSTIRRSGVLAPFERENLRGWKAGGAEQDKVKARLIMGSALSFWLATQAYKGDITGQGPSDPRKKQEWLASHQENSIKVGDRWYSIAGLEPVSTNITGIATLVERFKNGEISQEDYARSALSLAQGIGAVLSENSYLDGFQNLMDINSDDPDVAQMAMTNFLASIASSITTPAIVRKSAQTSDPAVRDTTGDGSFSDRVTGRIMSGLPGLSELLPQRYNVYGQEQTREFAGPDMASRTATRLEEDDPALIELARLADTTDQVLVGPPSKSNIKVKGVPTRINAKQFQAYQHLSGYWIVESVRQEMQTPEWDRYSDSEKREIVKKIVTVMRETARDYLFDPDNEQDDETETEEFLDDQ